MTFPRRWVALALLSTLPMFATAKPIAFAKGKTLMLEYGAGTSPTSSSRYQCLY